MTGMDSDEDVGIGMDVDEATKPSFLGTGKGKAVDKPRNNYDDDNLPWYVVSCATNSDRVV